MATVISSRPQLILPFQNAKLISAKPSTSRATFAQIQKNKDSLTTDEIVNIKKQKQMLLNERSMIIAKIARYEQLPIHKPNDGQNKRIADALEDDIKQLREIIQEKRNDIENVTFSDTACSITEAQEETKILHLELVRLSDIKGNTMSEIEEAQKKLDELTALYSPQKLWTMERDLDDLRKTVDAKVLSVDKLEFPEKYSKLVRESNMREQEENQLRKELLKKIKAMKAKCNDERKKISSLEKELNNTK